MEEEYARKKSRYLWLRASDKNTTFFHKHTEGRKIFKAVKEIQSQGHIIQEFKYVKKGAHDHFQKFYTE